MNKKYFLYGILSVIVMGNNQCLSEDFGVTSAMIGIGTGIGVASIYGIVKGGERTLPDAPEHFQRWAREILAENGFKNFATVPLKMRESWQDVFGVFIKVRDVDAMKVNAILSGQGNYSEAEKKDALQDAKYKLLRIKKHCENRTFLKNISYIMISVSVCGALAIQENVAAWGLALVCYTQFNTELKLQEQEADQYARMNCSSKAD